MNQAHGVRADEFKRAAGFNLSTGVISRPLAETLQDRPKQGVAADPAVAALGVGFTDAPRLRYRSLEAAEHSAKTRALAGPGPSRCCAGCGSNFRQSTPYGRAVYCSVACRDDAYKLKKNGAGRAIVRAAAELAKEPS